MGGKEVHLMHHIHQFLNRGVRMDFGALMFFTDYAISAVDLPRTDWARTIQLKNPGLFGRLFEGLPTGGDARHKGLACLAL